MSDNKDIRNQQDRDRINTSEPYELNYIAEKLGVRKEEILGAIAEVGNNRKDVEEYFAGKQRNR